ncbi:hypothetical protein DFH07DRAFT_951676 [Mycena maculata]|uniref:Uncharacterized protein n=1 Tax=Mycena maculata TaxID=230809 RepID=A0AAD7K1R8_9AGAR|nr:hypothetical protein DFH07DRAFT_951676 [Mycena maculata]
MQCKFLLAFAVSFVTLAVSAAPVPASSNVQIADREIDAPLVEIIDVAREAEPEAEEDPEARASHIFPNPSIWLSVWLVTPRDAPHHALLFPAHLIKHYSTALVHYCIDSSLFILAGLTYLPPHLVIAAYIHLTKSVSAAQDSFSARYTLYPYLSTPGPCIRIFIL